MTNRYRPGIRRNTASTPNIYIAGRVSMMRMLCPLSVLFLASVMSHPEYLFNYFCPVNLSFLIMRFYQTVIIQKNS